MMDIYMSDVYDNSRIFLAEGERSSEFSGMLEKHGIKASLIIPDTEPEPVARAMLKGSGSKTVSGKAVSPVEQTREVVRKVARSLGIKESIIETGLNLAEMDIGLAEIYKVSGHGKTIYFANAFAANDPFSSEILIDHMKLKMEGICSSAACILNLRKDRPERSSQWLRYLKREHPGIFKTVFIHGYNYQPFRRSIISAVEIKNSDPGMITEFVLSRLETGSLVFGLANIKGIGEELIKHWKKISSGTVIL
jgi:hypothetical protein